MSAARIPLFSLVTAIVLGALVGPVGAQSAYRFTSQPMQPGDRVSQEVELEFRLRIDARSAKNQASSTKNLDRHERRTLTLLPRENPDEPRAKIIFQESLERQHFATGVETNLQQPVAGKGYVITRRGGQLLITDLGGKAPPEDERAHVAASMDAFGRSNPLSEFIQRRAIAIGHPLPVPAAVAEKLFSAWAEMVKISEFTLTLGSIEPIHEAPCGIFEAVIKGVPKDKAGSRSELSGRIAIELATCRIPLVELAGPIRLSQTQEGDDGPVQIDCEGTIRVAMRSQAR